MSARSQCNQQCKEYVITFLVNTAVSCWRQVNLRVTNGAVSCAERVPWNVLIQNKNKQNQGMVTFMGVASL